MNIIDTHAHLEQTEFSNNLPQILERAREAGVQRILSIGTSLYTSRQCIKLAETYPDTLSASVGVHPTRCDKTDPTWMEQLTHLASVPAVAAIGETGLDFHHGYTDPSRQKEFFREHIHLSLDTGLPLVVHARKADPETLAVIEDESTCIQGVRHCFDSSKQIAQHYVELGMHIAVGGIITRPGHKKLKNAARWIPDDKLLVETDCPYMIPNGIKANHNEPAYIERTIQALATVREQPPSEIAHITTRNATNLFFNKQ